MDKASTSTGEPSDLFKSVLGGLSEEQWNEYKIQKKLEGGYEIDDEDDEELEENFIMDSLSNSPLHFDETLVTNFDLVENNNNDNDEDISDEEEIDIEEDKEDVTEDIAVKYVNGEIDFRALAESLAKRDIKRGRDSESEGEDESKIKTKKKRRRKFELPKEFVGLMGEANLCFANNNIDGAINKCIQIINSVPTVQVPYQLLSLIYEDQGEAKKSLECALVAAHLNPSDTGEWIRLANISLEQGQIPQAIRCLSFAIKNEPKNIDLLWQRCNLYEQLGEKKNALAGYKLILQNLNDATDGPKCLELARAIFKVHHSEEDLISAFRVLETAFSKFPTLITSEDINMLLEHQMSEKLYRIALKNLVLHCGVVLETNKGLIKAENIADFESDNKIEIIKCTYPDALHIDLMAKLLICLIHCKAINSIHEMLELLKKESPEDLGDLYFDVAEALMEINEPAIAKPLLSTLIHSEKYNVAGVWLKYADCLNMLLESEEATSAYEQVLKMAPSYQEARIPLSRLLVGSGDEKAAVDALKQDWESGESDSDVDMNVLMQRTEMLYKLGCYEEFIDAAKLTLLSHCLPVTTDEEVWAVVCNLTIRRRREALRELSSIANRVTPTFVNQNVSSSESLWDIFYKLCRKLFEFKQLDKLQTIIFIAMTSDQFKKVEKRVKDLDCLALCILYFNKNYRLMYAVTKNLLLKDLKNNRLLNLLSLNIIKSNSIRHNRFCLRLMTKYPDNIALSFFNGHNAMIFGTYKLALGEYANLLKKNPDNPEANFYVGITYIHLASQKFASKRPFLMFQGMAFLQKYIALKNESQESLYNMGRALHQLGIKDAALQYYKKAIDKPPPLDNDAFDLKREIAYNISLIYEPNDKVLAAMYLRTYNIV